MRDPDPRTDTHGVGIWVQTTAETWHRSITFDGYTHELACGTTLTADDPLREIDTDLSDRPTNGTVCRDCNDFWETETGA